MTGTPSEQPEVVAVSRDDNIAIVRMTRPRRRNALSNASLGALGAAFAAAADDPGVRGVVVTGDDAAFSSGQDMKEPEPPGYLEEFGRLMAVVETFPKPVVAAISGWCIAGGLELALCCDMRVAAEGAKIGDFHARINSIGGGGATARLPRLVGLQAARRLVFTGATLEAKDALDIGLVDEVAGLGDYLQRSLALCRSLVPGSPAVFAAAKRALLEGADLPLDAALAEALALQRALQLDLSRTEESVLARKVGQPGGA